MFINVEPAEFFMFRVKLIFDMEQPNSEDQQVRDYLTEHELEPKYQYTSELDDRQCQVMQFGGCYLGRRHLDSIGQIQRHAVEVELLTAEIEGHLNASTHPELHLPVETRQAAIAGLVEQFHDDSAFQKAENGDLLAVLDGDAVRAAAHDRMPASLDGVVNAPEGLTPLE